MEYHGILMGHQWNITEGRGMSWNINGISWNPVEYNGMLMEYLKSIDGHVQHPLEYQWNIMHPVAYNGI